MKLPKWLIKFTGDMYIHKYPMWFIYKPHHYSIKGYHIRKILKIISKGDIIFRRYNGYLNTFFTPGYWSHVGLIIDDRNVIHATSNGTIMEDILDFCRTDAVAVCSIPGITEREICSAISEASLINLDHIGYDYEFDPYNDKYYCTELINVCYNNRFLKLYRPILGKEVLIPDDLFNVLTKKCVYKK